MRVSHLYPIVLVIVVGILGGTAYTRFSATPETQVAAPEQQATTTPTKPVRSESQNIPTPAGTQVPTPDTYTSAEVATHTSAASCWTSINGNVYDVTSWVSKHPGGERAILSQCGRDGTAMFTAQHGGDSRPEQMLASFRIGTLAQ